MKMDKINEGHYLELMDRLHVIACNISEHLIEHPLTDHYPEVKVDIEIALEHITDAYQRVGNLEYKNSKKDNEK